MSHNLKIGVLNKAVRIRYDYDGFEFTSSHLIPALMRKAHEKKFNQADSIGLGTGNIKVAFLLVNECTEGIIVFSNAELFREGAYQH